MHSQRPRIEIDVLIQASNGREVARGRGYFIAYAPMLANSNESPGPSSIYELACSIAEDLPSDASSPQRRSSLHSC